MKVCFPVQKDEGIESQVYNHFGSAPVFIVVDTRGKGSATGRQHGTSITSMAPATRSWPWADKKLMPWSSEE